jgi:RNA polymerase sigma-70 factor (ECF subfamily)
METSVSFLQRLLDEPDTAWDKMYDLYGPWLKRWLVRWDPSLGTDADDVLQDVMVVVVRDLPRFRHQGQGKFRGWLKTIAVNSLKHHQRSRRRHPQLLSKAENDILARLEDPASELSQQWDREHDQYVIKRLLESIEVEFNPTDLHAFRRLVLDGAKADAVAAELNVTVNVVYLARSRILHRLREEGREFLG